MAFQIGLKAVNILHRQGHDGSVPIGAVEDDRASQIPLACQLEDLRRIVADKQRRTLHGNQGIVLVKTRQNEGASSSMIMVSSMSGPMAAR